MRIMLFSDVPPDRLGAGESCPGYDIGVRATLVHRSMAQLEMTYVATFAVVIGFSLAGWSRARSDPCHTLDEQALN